MSQNRDRYIEISRRYPLPLHFQPWWLDAVCTRGAWDACIATDRGGNPTGVMPYCIERVLGAKRIVHPPYTSYSGPWLFYPSQPGIKKAVLYAFEMKTMEELIHQLPGCAYFRQNFHPQCTNWYPFYWAGFRQTTRYTYRIDLHGNTEEGALWHAAVRKKVQRSTAAAELIENVDPEEAVNLHKGSRMRLGHLPDKELDALRNLIAALLDRKQMIILGLKEKEGRGLLAAQAVAFDPPNASFLFAGQVFNSTVPYLNYRMLAEAIGWCAARSLSIDLEGSMHRGVEQVLRSMGGERTPYFQVTRVRPRLLEAALVLLKKSQ